MQLLEAADDAAGKAAKAARAARDALAQVLRERGTLARELDGELLKLIDQALARMRVALAEMRVEGIQTNLPLHRSLLSDPGVVAGGVTSTARSALTIGGHWCVVVLQVRPAQSALVLHPHMLVGRQMAPTLVALQLLVLVAVHCTQVFVAPTSQMRPA